MNHEGRERRRLTNALFHDNMYTGTWS